MDRRISRVSLLRGRFGGAADVIRPPWTVPEDAFIDGCTRCDACIKACPESIVSRGRGGFPSVSFETGECTFCGECRSVCEAGVFVSADDGNAPWSITITVGSACVAHSGVMCRICEEQCEARAIRFPRLGGGGVPHVEAGACTGCGACIAPCPTSALTAAPRKIEEVAA